MTPDEARIVLLEDALEQAVHTVSFLHGCLTNDQFSYAHPEQTNAQLDKWTELIPEMAQSCFHSRYDEQCPSCQQRVMAAERKQEAQTVLAEDAGPSHKRR